MPSSYFRIVLSALTVVLCAAHLTAAQAAADAPEALFARLEVEDHRVQSVAFSPDGRLLAAGYGFYDDGGVTIWRVADHSVVATLLDGKSSKAGIECVAFSPDGNLFAAASDRGDVMLWTVGNWRSHKTLLTKRGDTTDLSFSPDGNALAFSTEDAAILYDLKSGGAVVIAKGGGFGKNINGVSFSPDGRFVVVCEDRAIRLWDVAGRKIVKVFEPASGGFFGRLSPDGGHVVAGGGAVYGRKSVEIWDFKEGRRVSELTDFRAGLFALSISNSGRLFAVAGGDYGSGGGDLSLWSLDGPRELGFVSFGDFPIEGVAFSPDDKLLAAASESGFVLLYSVERMRGPHVKAQDFALCGEVAREGGKTFIVPISKVPTPMSIDFVFPWKLEIANADVLTEAVGSPVVFEDWAIESGAADDRARVRKFRTLKQRAGDSEHVTFGDVQNPGWGEGFVVKVYGDGNFVAASNSGKCLSYGNLSRLNADYESLKKRLLSEGLVEVPVNPLTLGVDHYRTRFIEMTADGVPELRSDADSIEILLKGGPAKKREAFKRVYEREEQFVNSLVHAGTSPPAN